MNYHIENIVVYYRKSNQDSAFAENNIKIPFVTKTGGVNFVALKEVLIQDNQSFFMVAEENIRLAT